MRTSARGWILPVLLSCGLGAGCGKDEVPAGGRSAAEIERPRRDPPDAADAAVLAVLDGMKKDHPEAVWDFLPDSYQRDLNDLMHGFAQRMDPELWNKGVAVFRKLVGVLKTKKAFLAADMTRVAGLTETLLDSDLADLEKMKSFEGRRFLAGTGARLIGQLHDLGQDLGGMLQIKKVTLVKFRGDTATLELKTSQETTEREFVRVEGKWIPKDLAEGWIEQIGEAKARLSVLSPENLGEMKPQILSLLEAIDGVLDRLAAARNQEEFRAGLGEADIQFAPFKALVAGWLGGSAGGPDAGGADAGETAVGEPARDEALEFVTIVVTGMLDDDAQDALRARLNAVADNRDLAESEITGDDETTTIKVGPVSDIESYAKRLDFLKITSIDAKTRTITAEPRN